MAKTVVHAVLEADVPRLDLAVQAATKLPRAFIRGLFDHGCVQLDGHLCDQAAQPARAGGNLCVTYEPDRRYKPIAKPHTTGNLHVVFEDRHLIVVDKPAGILTVPNFADEQRTLVHLVAQHLSKGPRITHRAHIVHRLDRDTSGLLVFGKTAAIAERLKDQFADRKPEREYLAIVAGQLRDDSGTMRSFLATDDDLNQRSVQAHEGKLAVTHFVVTARLQQATQVRVNLETGRRNQIRVHFSEIGHPVLGDQRYEVDLARHRHWRHNRLALHARTLGLVHPVTGALLRLSAEVPVQFTDFARSATLR